MYTESGELRGDTEPRIFTRPLRELTPETSLGFEAIATATEDLGRNLHPWQEWVLIHSLELAPGSYTSDPAPVLRFETVLVLVARQNGKSFLASTRMLWRMLMWDPPEGEPPLVLGTAHKLAAAEEIQEQAYKAIARSPAADQVARMTGTNGSKTLELINGARYRCDAASDDGGRSFSVTDLFFDELRQQKEWSPWMALTNTTNAKFSSQVFAVSNAGESKSVVLNSLQDNERKAIQEYDAFISGGGTPEEWAKTHEITFGLFEYSAPEGAPIHDRDGWAAANPSLGYPFGPTERKLAATVALVGDQGKEGVPEYKFRAEVLCQRVAMAADGPFKQEDLDACLSPGGEIDLSSPLVVGVDTSADGKMSYIAVAGYRADGVPQVEILTKRPFMDWIPDFLENQLNFTPRDIVLQGKGAPISSYREPLLRQGINFTPCEASNLPAACAQFAERVEQHKVSWRDQPILRKPLEEAVKKYYGDVWSWNRERSPVDIAPLCAATFALWGLLRLQDNEEDKKSVYSDPEYDEWWR